MKKQLIDREIDACMAELRSLKKDQIVLRSACKLVGKHDFLGASVTPINFSKVGFDGPHSNYEVQIRGRTIQVTRSAECTTPDSKIEKIFKMKAFVDWCNNFDEEYFRKYQFHKIEIHSVDMFGPNVGFLKFRPVIFELRKDPDTKEIIMKDGRPETSEISSIIFMRGNSVAMLPIFHCDGQVYTCLTVQNRVPTARYSFKEIPAGMMDNEGNFIGVAAKEMKEEMDIAVKDEDLIDMITEAGIVAENGIALSPGGCDESMRFLLYRTNITPAELMKFQGKCTGNIAEGEKITLQVMKLEDLPNECQDAKTVVALYLYNRIDVKYRLPPVIVISLETADLTKIKQLLHAIEQGRPNLVKMYTSLIRQIPEFLDKVILPNYAVEGLTNEQLKNLKLWAIDELKNS